MIKRICPVCGTAFYVEPSYNARKTCSKRCHSLASAMHQPKKQLPRDITGQRFGRLTAVCRTDDQYRGAYIWHCKCDCGNDVFTTTANLRSGHTKSCGCLRKDNALAQSHARYGLQDNHIQVTFVANRGCYVVRRKLDGKQYHLGSFGTREAAEEFREVAKQISAEDFPAWIASVREQRKQERKKKT